MTADLKFHPLAGIFPLMEGAEFDALVADIKDNDLRDPIVLFEGKILDGCNRYHACLVADVPVVTRSVDEFINNSDDAVAYVVSANIHRRHLDTKQRRRVIARLLKARPEASDRVTRACLGHPCLRTWTLRSRWRRDQRLQE